MTDETDMGDPYPHVIIGVFYNESDEAVNFKLFDHSTGIEYDNCISNMEILTGHEHVELYFDYEEAVVLNYISPITPVFTKDIIGYGDGEDHFYLIATPIDNVNPTEVEGMIPEEDNHYDLYWFNQSEDLEWRNYKEEPFRLASGKGYLYANKDDVTLTFSGAPIEGDSYEVRLVKDDAAGGFSGWNLVGNPFAEQTAYIDRPFYVMNSGGSEIIAAADVEQNSIAPMEGVFVIADENDEGLTFTTAPQNGNGKGLVLNLSKGASTGSATRGGSVIDRVLVRFGEGRELPKFQMRSNSTKLYIPQMGKDYAVVNAEDQGEMPVNFKANENGTYTLSVSEALTASTSSITYLHLIDCLTGADVDLLADPSYRFEAKTTDYASRFKLVFMKQDEADKDNPFAFISQGKLHILNDGEAKLEIMDVTGRMLRAQTLQGNGTEMDLPEVPGVYLLRLTSEQAMRTQKLLVK